MRKQKLVKTLEYRGIPIILRDYVPKNELWFANGDSPIDIFDKGIVKMNIKTGLIKKVRFISKFKKRRFGKSTNIEL